MRRGILSILQTNSEVFRFSGSCSWFSWRVFLVFSGVPVVLGVAGWSDVPCSGVAGNTTCRFKKFDLYIFCTVRLIIV